MRIPGFTAESAVYGTGATRSRRLSHPGAGPDGDRIIPQGLCEIELRPVCRNRCRRSSNPQRCVTECLDDMCSPDYYDKHPW